MAKSAIEEGYTEVAPTPLEGLEGYTEVTETSVLPPIDVYSGISDPNDVVVKAKEVQELAIKFESPIGVIEQKFNAYNEANNRNDNISSISQELWEQTSKEVKKEGLPELFISPIADYLVREQMNRRSADTKVVKDYLGKAKARDVIRSASNEDFDFIRQAVITDSENFDGSLIQLIAREDAVRRRMVELQDVSGVRQNLMYAFANFTNLFNLNEYLDRQGLNPFNKGEYSLTLEAVNRILAERPLDAGTLAVQIGTEVPKIMLEFMTLPDVGSKIKMLEKVPRLRSMVLVGTKLAIRQAVQAPEAAETLAERSKKVLTSGIMGMGIGATGAFIPTTAIRAPVNITGFALLTYAMGGSKEDVIRTAATIGAFEAVGLVRKGEAALGRKYRKTLEQKVLKSKVLKMKDVAKEKGIDLTKVPENALENLAKAANKFEWWQNQYTKGKITLDVFNQRTHAEVQTMRSIFGAIGRSQKVPGKPTAKPSAITKKNQLSLSKGLQKKTGVSKPVADRAAKMIYEEGKSVGEADKLISQAKYIGEDAALAEVEPPSIEAEKPPSKPVQPSKPKITPKPAVEGGVKVLKDQGKLGVWEENVFLPDPQSELDKIVSVVRQNEGEPAAKIVKSLLGKGIQTESVHDTKDEIIVGVSNLSAENKAILKDAGLVVKKMPPLSGEFIHFPKQAQPPAKPVAEGKKAIALTDKEVHELMSESLDKNEYTMYLQDEVQARTQGDVEAAGRAFDQEANILFDRGYLYDENNKEWVRVSAKEKERVEKLAKEKLVEPKKVEPKPKPKPKGVQLEEKRAEKRDILGGVDPIQQIHKALKAAETVRPITEAAKKAELKRRVGAAAGALKTNLKKGVPAEEAIFKSTGLLKGPLAEYDQVYESIEDILESSVKNAAYLKIANHPDLRYFEVIHTTTSFKKLLAGTYLTPGDVQNIERVFGKAFEDITKPRMTRSGLYERLVTLWKAGLLTGIKTSFLNIMSTASHAVSETAKDIPASLIDSGISLFTKERTVAFTAKGYGIGFVEGLGKGWSYMRTGYDTRNVGQKYDYKKTNFGTSKLAKAQQAYTEFIFHLLGAEDQPFYYGAFSRSLYSQSIAQGKTKGLKGKELKAFVNKLQQNPTDDMLTWAKEDAETAIYTNRTRLGDLGRSIQKIGGGDIIAPFTRTPSAVAMQIINYSPIGIVKEISHQIHKGEFSQRNVSQAGGRSVMGTGALFLGTLLFVKGLISLGYPKTERERKLWEVEGRKPNSIKVNGKWRDVQALGPVGNLLIIGGYFQQALDSKGSPTEAIVEAMAGGGKSFSEQTFVRGVNLAVDALTDPEASFERWFTSMAGSIVPTIVADIARAQDDVSRRAVGPKERIQSRIPIYRRGLPPAIDIFGQDLPRYGGNVLETMADPTRPSKIRQDIVVDELRRLWDNNIKVSPTQLGDKKGYDILTVEENTQLWQRSGELIYKAIFALINGEKYRKLDDFAKGLNIEDVVGKAKRAAKLELVQIKIGQGVSMKKIAETGLFTIEDFEMLKYYEGLE